MTVPKDQRLSPGTLDNIIEKLGLWRKYHIINYILIFFATFLAGLYTESFVFTAGEIDFRCEVSECESLPESNWTKWAFPVKDNQLLDKCNRYGVNLNKSSSEICTLDWFDNTTSVVCDQFVYGLNGESSIVKDFNLGCQQWKRTIVGAAYKVGFFISIGLSGIFSDRYGRKNALAFSAFLKGTMGLIRSFSNSYEMFTVLQFLESAFGGGLYISTFILLMEIASPKNRLLVSCLNSICFSLGMASMAVLSWLIRDWKTMLQIIYTPAIFIIFYIFIIDESVRWLLAKNRHKDAVKIIRKVERINGVTIPESLIFELLESRKHSHKDEQNEEENKFIDSKKVETYKALTITNVFHSSTILKRVTCCFFLWFTCTFTFHGISINSVRLTENQHVGYIIISLTQIPAYVTAYLIMDRFGRRTTLIVPLIICGISTFSLAFTSKNTFVIAIILSMCGKFTISLAQATLHLYTSEIFPTFLRHSLVGACATVSRFGSLLASQIQLMAYYVDILPSILFGLFTLLSGILSFTIPETAKIKLPDTIEEAENIRKK